MLSELLELERALGAANVDVVVPHPQIKALANRPVLRAQVDASGRVAYVSVIDAKSGPRFWRLGDKQKKFPLLSIGPRDDNRSGKIRKPVPLRPRADSQLLAVVMSTRAPLQDRISGLRELFSSTSPDIEPLLPWPEHRTWLKTVRESLKGLTSTPAAQVLQLLDLVLHDPDGQVMLQSLDATLLAAAQNPLDADALELICKIAFSGGGELLLDTTDRDGSSACDPSNQVHLQAALGEAEPDATSGRCSLSGAHGPVVAGPFPEARLPAIGDVAIFDKNPDIPSAKRYHREGSKGCTVSRDLARRLVGAVQTATSPEREGMTWSRVASDRPVRKGRKAPPWDLLISYVAAPNNLRLSGAVTGDASVFEALSSDIVKLAQGQSVDSSAQARFMVIRKLSKGNQKVLTRNNASLSELAASAERWTAGCRNIPPQLQILDEEGKARGPRLLVPAAIVALGKQVFIRGGRERLEAPGPPFSDAMRLFLGSVTVRRHTAATLLPVLLARRWALVASIGNAQRKGELKGFDAWGALDSVTLIALLLHEQGRTKEAYMEDAAFKLGQLLSGADVLHRGYCDHQRGGSIPPSMLGNQMLALAQRLPMAALDHLCQRWRVYAGWADKYRGKIARPADRASPSDWAIHDALWAPLNMRSVADSLRGVVPSKADTRFRAELLLGYIAGLPRPAKPDHVTTQVSTSGVDASPED